MASKIVSLVTYRRDDLVVSAMTFNVRAGKRWHPELLAVEVDLVVLTINLSTIKTISSNYCK